MQNRVIPEKIESPIKEIVEAVTDTKFAAALITLGAKLQKMFTLLDRSNPRSTGGTSYFLFNSNSDVVISDFKKTWDAGTADEDLDKILEEAKSDPALREFAEKVEEALEASNLVHSRKVLENYQRLGYFFRDEAEEFIIADDQIVYYPRRKR